MATSSGGGVGDVVSYKAAHDLSSNQFHFVRISAANTVGSSTVNGTAICSILQGNPASAGLGADVSLVGGVSKLEMGGTCTAGDMIVAGTNGKGVIADAGTTVFVNAIANEAASASGDIISVNTVAFYNTSGVK